MTKLWAFIRHNSGMIIGATLCTLILAWTYGCESEVKSVQNPAVLVTRSELEIEVDNFLKMAKIRFTELDQQDAFKRTFFAMAMTFMEGGRINPAAIALTLGNILGLGAVIDNIRKRTVLNVRKSNNAA